MIRFVLCFFILAIFGVLVGCTDAEQETNGDEQDLHTSSGQSIDISISGYDEIEVTNGGMISGRVFTTDPLPEMPTFEITSDPAVCASAAEYNRMKVGNGGGIGNAIVFLDGIRRGKAVPELPVEQRVVDQQGCRYEPHVLAVPIGTEVVFRNSDPVQHNVRVEDDAVDTIMLNVAQPVTGREDQMVVSVEGPLSVGCDYHPWMNAYVFGVGHPYYTVTDAGGQFSISDIPPGEYSVSMWLNGIHVIPRRDNQGKLVRYAYSDPIVQKQTVLIQTGKEAEIQFEVDVNEE